LLKSEARILLLEKSRGSLVDIDVCKSFISKTLTPTIIWLRKLSEAGRNPEERALLKTLRDAGLALSMLQRRRLMNSVANDQEDEETILQSGHRV
jgi:hypothetical protein